MKSNDQSVNRIGRESIRAKLAAQICNGESVIRQNMPYPICMFNYIHTICLAPVVQTLDSAIRRLNNRALVFKKFEAVSPIYHEGHDLLSSSINSAAGRRAS